MLILSKFKDITTDFSNSYAKPCRIVEFATSFINVISMCQGKTIIWEAVNSTDQIKELDAMVVKVDKMFIVKITNMLISNRKMWEV